MQCQNAMDKALARLGAVASSRVPPPLGREPSYDTLLKHAARWGEEGILYTAWQRGWNNTRLFDLAVELDKLRCAKAKRPVPLTTTQLRRSVDRVGGYLR